MRTPEGEVECDRCRKRLETTTNQSARLAFCSPECRCEYQISHGFRRLDDAVVERPRRREEGVSETPRRRARQETEELQREIEMTGRQRFALWLLVVAFAAFLASVLWYARKSGAGITFAGKTIVRPK